jgi:HEAT repeat protein
LDISETRTILEALRDIGDKRAIDPIKAYLKGDYPKESKAVAKRVLAQLESADVVTVLLTLLEKEEYEPERSSLLQDLTRYPDERVLKRLRTLAETSPSAFMRREAIHGLARIGNREALLALSALLAADYPADLKAEWGWKSPPEFRTYFPELIAESLRERTHQDFGRDRARWTDWIARHVK